MSGAPRSNDAFVPPPQGPLRGVATRPANEFVPFLKNEIDKSISDRFEQQVRKYPRHIAVKVRDRIVTYVELNEFANRIGWGILGQSNDGIKPVGLLLEKDASMMAAMLGALKAGGVYVPLDPAHPYPRLQRQLDDAGAELLITDNRSLNLAERLAHGTTRVLNIDRDVSSLSTEDIGLGVSCDAPCYIIYTSGSMGEPKGVVQSHRSVLHNIKWHTNSLQLCGHDRFTLLASCAAGQAVTDIYAALLNGAALYPFDIRKEGFARLKDLLINEEITVYHSSASVFSYFVDSLAGDEEFPTLRFIKLGGESVSNKEVDMYKKHFSAGCRLVNTLSSTETGTVRQYIIDKNTKVNGNIAPVGYPVDDKHVLLLNEAGQEVGFDEVGEICIDSSFLSPGYWRQPDASSRKFAPAPGGTKGRIYRTGDLGRMDRQNCLTYLGRKDSRVKISGHTIEIAEVEAALRGVVGVADVAVAAREHRGEQRLIAYLVPKKGVELSPSTLRKLLAEMLPDHMIPSNFVTLDVLPRTPNGKVAREELPAPEEIRPSLDAAFVAPRSPLEKTLATIFAEVLGISELGVNDNFFDLGGNSLMAAQVLARLQKVTESAVPMRAFFENPTLAGVAQVVVEHQPETRNGPIPRRENEGPIPLSFPQERLWFLNQFDATSPSYNICRAVHIKGKLDRNVLQRSLDDLVARHEPLRTIFKWVDDSPIQEVLAKSDLTIKTVNLTNLQGNPQEEEVWRLLRADSRLPFDLSSDLPIRATILQCNDEEHWLLLVMHHIATDGWSMGILFRELGDLYESHSSGNPCQLLELPVQHTDFAQWQRECLRGDVLERDIAYWKERLAGASPVLAFPTDFPRPERQSLAGSSEPVFLSASLTESLRALSRRSGVSLFMTLLAALQVLLHRYTGETDLCVGTAVANRPKVELEPLIGFFVNTLVLRTDLSREPNFRELLERVRETALGAFAYQNLPFEKLVETLQPERSLKHSPLFQVMFILNNTPRKSLRLSGVSTEDFKIDNGTAKYDLTLSLSDAGPNLKGTLEYSTELFQPETIRRILGHYRALLEAVVQDLDQSISTLPILATGERRRILLEWNDTKAEYPPVCVHEIFEAQAERTPDAVAVVDEDAHMTYAELNRRANQLARHLMSLGVGPEALVGVCLERSAQTFVALLGILKAGAAYVPLDPSYPAERLAFMLEDSGAGVLLTQSELLGRLPLSASAVVCIDRDSAAIARHGAENPVRALKPENLLYAIYTSGSTGKPKGVMATHRATVNRLNWMWTKYPFGTDEVACQKTPLGFVDSVWEIFGALLKGISTVVIRDEAVKDPQALVETLAIARVTRVVLVPSLLHAILEVVPNLSSRLPRLKYCVSSGEALSSDLANRFRKSLPECALLNLYGSTEVAGDATCYEAANDLSVSLVPIGRPIANTQVHILDRHLEPVPIGVSGELHIGGEGLACGYHNRPEVTAERFISNPFREETGARLYKTGDLARYLPDGNIEFLGRRDDQVKIRGFRIELGEIEAVLAKHPALKTAAVVVREESPGDKRLLAYATLREGSAPTAEELRKFLRSNLPDYMVPWKFEFLASLPLTPSGKVDRRSLPVPGNSSLYKTREYVAPRTDLEKKLARIWAEVLKLDRVSIHDNFFDLGGYSLLAVKLIKTIEKESVRRISLASLFRAPTISELALLLSDSKSPEDVEGVIPIQAEGTRPPFICIGTSPVSGPIYRPLALRLGLDQPFLCVSTVDADIQALTAPFLLEDIAAALVRRLISIQPHGPYFIGGWCGPGLLAYEVAQQLRAKGEKVGLLVLFDTLNVSRRRENARSEGFRIQFNRRARKLRRYLAKLSKFSWSERRADFAAVLNFREKRLRHKLWRSYYKLHLAIHGQFGDRFRKFFNAGYGSVAIRNYLPKPYPDPVLVIWSASENKQEVQDREMNWRGLLTGNPEVHCVPGRHKKMFFEPNVAVLASTLERGLSKAQETDQESTEERS
jgi:amino acid adenylation domain-containing protein